MEKAKSLGCYFVDETEKLKLENAVMKGKGINPEIVGKSAKVIAEYAGFSVPDNTSVLVAYCETVGRDEPLSMEKLSPILAFYTVDGWLEGCHKCIELLEFGGVGHSLVIHSNDHDVIMKFAMEKPAFRIVVNTPSSIGAVGYTTKLAPSLTLGVGTWGGSIVSENVTAKHLMNVKTLAFESNPVNPGESLNNYNQKSVNGTTTNASEFINQIEERLRARAGNPTVAAAQTKSKAPTNDASSGSLGSGISASEIDKIIKEFNS